MITKLLKSVTSHKAIGRCLQCFARNDDGSVLPIYAASLGLVVTSVGGALTLSNYMFAKNELRAAADAAALAAANTYTALDRSNAALESGQQMSQATIEGKVREAALNVFNANAKASGLGIDEDDLEITVDPKPVVSSTQGRSIQVGVKVKAKVPMMLSQFMGQEGGKMTVDIDAEATRDLPKKLEIVLALDTTGSMAHKASYTDTDSKIVGLRKAVMSLVDELYGEELPTTATPPANVKLGIIPYAQAVNIGKLLTQGDELQVDADIAGFASMSGNNGWAGCVLERPTNQGLNALQAKGAITVPADAWDVIDRPMEAADPKWKVFYADPVEVYMRNPDDTDEWLSRGTTNWFKPSDFGSLRPRVRLERNGIGDFYKRAVSASTDGGSGSPNEGCSKPALALASGYTKAQIQTYVNGLSPEGYTHSNIGMAWANRMLSPWGPLTGGVAYGDGKTNKVIVLMTDGYITSGDEYNYTNNNRDKFGLLKARGTYTWAGYYNGYGLAADSLMVGRDALTWQPNANSDTTVIAHQQRLLMACQIARKPHGYTSNDPATRVFTVLFGFSVAAGERNIYKECATNPGTDYVEATSNEKLIAAFRKIGRQTNLRLSK